MRPSFDSRTLLGLCLGLVASISIASTFSNEQELVALGSGYILFAINYVMLAKIYRALILIVQFGRGNSRTRWLVTLGTGLKFIGLIGALYFLLVYRALPGFYLAVGSLVSLFVLTWILVSSYLRTLNASQRP